MHSGFGGQKRCESKPRGTFRSDVQVASIKRANPACFKFVHESVPGERDVELRAFPRGRALPRKGLSASSHLMANENAYYGRTAARPFSQSQ